MEVTEKTIEVTKTYTRWYISHFFINEKRKLRLTQNKEKKKNGMLFLYFEKVILIQKKNNCKCQCQRWVVIYHHW